jgi:hypothetical protein
MEPDDPLMKEARPDFQRGGGGRRFGCIAATSILPDRKRRNRPLSHGVRAGREAAMAFRHLLETQYADGGWRCKNSSSATR